MSLLKRAKCVVVYDGPGEGWLPSGAALPSAKSAALELVIRQTPEGFFLESTSSNPLYSGGDTWHQSYAQAVAQAQQQFGISPEAWRDVAA